MCVYMCMRVCVESTECLLIQFAWLASPRNPLVSTSIVMGL